VRFQKVDHTYIKEAPTVLLIVATALQYFQYSYIVHARQLEALTNFKSNIYVTRAAKLVLVLYSSRLIDLFSNNYYVYVAAETYRSWGNFELFVREATSQMTTLELCFSTGLDLSTTHLTLRQDLILPRHSTD
jgi:hypothetical protein